MIRHDRASQRARRVQLQWLGALVAGALPLQGTAQDATDAHAAGRAVYTQWCAPCHDPGITHPGTHALMVKYAGTKSGVLLERRDLTAAFVSFTVRHGVSVMPQFRKTEISDAQLAALGSFLARNTSP